MPKSKVTEIAVKIVDMLTPLTSEERQRVVHAALTLMGEAPLVDTKRSDQSEDSVDAGLHHRARAWMKQNDLTAEDLQHVFHLAGGRAEVIASEIPGKSDKEKTLNAYVLIGVANLLSNGDANFDDKAARDLCGTLGCFNGANHAAYMKNKGNQIAGSKEKGWTLTSPGLKRGAALVKELSK